MLYHMRRFGDSYWQLDRAVLRWNETFDSLLSWIQGARLPRSVASFYILRRIEQSTGRVITKNVWQTACSVASAQKQVLISGHVRYSSQI
ncbi:hypothetical protein CO662_23620 [Rhizobium anhuiense]|jgi:hypothetical protein|uniref:Uncharacterized protein n=1 Tax=Rhizobium anhuiense TaxID=1184720 RepID=A0A3S0SUQ8_9HYPH|nr:hypothetical protein [Rhizobium anhuiense]PDS34297.1 hypothetical protein CO665_31840 [Rhizobium anhuiense]PDS41403.1 hypothetical protein CO668_28875 [Rhizobium anhuiense]PDS49583.1 hypothetical protein CO662_23620 [Rhizobium anhuiense]PDS61627.1 hypothetical protein CO653_32095 [Rhizobium anhuiense]